MNVRKLALAAALIATVIQHALAGETLKIASPQRGSWEGAIPELGQQAGIFLKHGLDLEILYTQGGGETLQIVVSGAVDIAERERRSPMRAKRQARRETRQSGRHEYRLMSSLRFRPLHDHDLAP
jgi:hypothetical protein